MLPDPEFVPSQCLDALEVSLRSLLLRTGSALSEPTNLDATNITLTKDRVRRTFPVALDNFHRALGDLELSLTRAKSVLYRDYTALQQEAARLALNDQAVISNGLQDFTDHTQSSDVAGVEAQQHAILSHAVGPLTLPHDDEINKLLINTKSKEGEEQTLGPNLTPTDDPLAHPKPNERPIQSPSKQILKTEAISNTEPRGRNEPNEIHIQMNNMGDSKTNSDDESKSVRASNVEAQRDSSAACLVDEGNTSKQAPSNGKTPPPNPHLEDVSTLLPDLELYAQQDEINGHSKNDYFNIEDSATTNTLTDDAVKITLNQESNVDTDLPDDFLQSDADNGMSFDEQFDFGSFEFGNIGDGDSADGNGANNGMQDWDANFFDDSLFNLDGEAE